MAPLIHRKNFHSFCRTCLKEIAALSSAKGQKFNLHQSPNLLEWFNVCTSLDVNKKDEYPKFMCEECYKNLKSFYEFREMTIKSKQTLDSILSNGKIETETRFQMTKTELLDNEPETQEQDTWLDFKVDDKSLITSTFVNNLESIKNEIVTNETGNSKGSLKDRKLFEYKNCSEYSFEKNIEDLQNATDFLEVGINIKTVDEIENTLDDEIVENSLNEVPKFKIPKVSLRCSLCPRVFYKKEKLDTHLRVHQGLKAYQCNQCDRGYSKKYRLNYHISRDHDNIGNEKMICSIDGCGTKCKKSDSYNSHFCRKHILKMVICEDCGLCFKTNASLKKHRFIHGPPEAYPFICDQCGKRFSQKYKYKEHMDRHAGIKNFECSICGLKKTTNDDLRTHMNFHTKEKQWPCLDCNTVFNKSGNLNRHIRVVHKGIRKFPCKYCNESFGKAESLKHHEMRHTGEKPHQCQACGKRFIEKSSLRRHMKTHERKQCAK